MTTLGGIFGSLGGSIRRAGGAISSGSGQAAQNAANAATIYLPPPPDPNTGLQQPDAPTGADNGDALLAAINDALSSGRSGGGGFRGSAGNSQAQTDLGLRQQTDLLNLEKGTLATNFKLQGEELQAKQDMAGYSYQSQLAALKDQYGANMFNLNASAAASGAYTSSGANLNRTDLTNALGRNYGDATRQLEYTNKLINEARVKAFSNAILSGTKLDQALAMNSLQRQEAGI